MNSIKSYCIVSTKLCLYTALYILGTHSQNITEKYQTKRLGKASYDDGLFLTPYITAGHLQQARLMSRLTNFTNIESYSGYLTVDPKYNSNLFFWFFPSVTNPEIAPVLLWLQGGPGATSLFGLFVSLGPFVLDKNQNIKLRNTSWTLTHSVIFVDNPVGTGFSFTDSPEGYSTTDEEVANNLYKFLTQFFRLFPMYAQNDFFLTGESYAGKYIPATAYKIHLENQRIKATSMKIKLKGLAMGNAITDPIHMFNWGDTLYTFGLIDPMEQKHFHKQEEKARLLTRLGRYKEAYEITNSLFFDDYETGHSYFTNVTGCTYYYDVLLDKETPDQTAFLNFLNKPYVRVLIHARKIGTLVLVNFKVNRYLLNNHARSMAHVLVYLLDRPEQYNILLYNGNLDLCTPPISTEEMIKHLKWEWTTSFLQAKKLTWRVKGKLAGYYKSFKNLGYLLVRNAGHVVPYYQGVNALEMINRFTSGKHIVKN